MANTRMMQDAIAGARRDLDGDNLTRENTRVYLNMVSGAAISGRFISYNPAAGYLVLELGPGNKESERRTYIDQAVIGTIRLVTGVGVATVTMRL